MEAGGIKIWLWGEGIFLGGSGGGDEQIFDRWGEDFTISPVEKTLDLLVISYKILH